MSSHVESDSENDSDQSLLPKSLVLESMEATPITKLSSFIIEKIQLSLIKPKSVKKLINNTLLVKVSKKTFPDLQQKYFYNLKIKTYPYN